MIFEKAALDKIIQQQLVNVPPEHKIAVVTNVSPDKDGKAILTTAFAYKPGDNWQIESYVQTSHDHGLDYGASVQWSK